MIYLSFTAAIPDRPYPGDRKKRFGKITLNLLDKTYQMIPTSSFPRLQGGEPRPQYLELDSESQDLPLYQRILGRTSERIRTGIEPFYLPLEEASLDTLKSIRILIVELEEYETSVFVVGSGRQTAFRPCGVISQTVENVLPALSSGQNGYEVQLNFVNHKITLDFLPKKVILDNLTLPVTSAVQTVAKPQAEVKANETVSSTVDSIVADSVIGLDKKASPQDIQSQLEIARRGLELFLATEASLSQHRAFAFALLNQKFHMKINEIQPTSMPVKTKPAQFTNCFMIPDFDKRKEALIASLNGTARHFKNDTFQITIDSTLLKKEIRQQLGIDRFKFKATKHVNDRLQFLGIYCDTTVESQPDGAYLITFPANNIELVKKVAYRWEDVHEEMQTESGRHTLFCK